MANRLTGLSICILVVQDPGFFQISKGNYFFIKIIEPKKSKEKTKKEYSFVDIQYVF
jgi:hypothetical protein